MKNKKIVLFSIVALLVLFVGLGYQYNKSESEKLTTLAKEKAMLFKRDYSYTMGPDDAKVQLVEFFDPACETCAQFHPLVKDKIKKSDGNIKIVYRYAPFHKNSNFAVKMLEGAREQGLFMETLEFMFSTQRYWVIHHEVNPQLLWRMLSKVEGLDMEKLGEFMNNPKADEIIKQDLEDAAKLGATKTPSYFVNGKPLQQFGLQNLKDLIQSEMDK